MLVYDDLEPSEKIKVYDSGIHLAEDDEKVRKMLVSYRIGDMWAPALESKEALSVLASHFVECVNTHRLPDTSGEVGLAVVRAMAAATHSIRLLGRAINVNTLQPYDGDD
jgi:hypothetical protein